MSSTADFLQRLRQFVQAEAEAQWQALKRLSDDEREALIRDHTRKLYMATTRAGQRLVLTYVGELPGVLKTVFGQTA